MNFHFVFYFTQKSEFKILLHLQDIAPSRLTSLLNTMNYVDAPEYAGSVFEHYANQFSNQDKPPIFNFSFSLLRTFFPNSPIEGDFDALFLELVNNVFIGKNIDNQILLEHFMQKIRFVFLDNKRSPTSYQITVMQAYKIVLYVKEIKQLIYTSGGKMEPNVPYAEFFDQQKLLDDYGKRAVFLLGVLSQKLINIQYKEKRSTPFRSRLNNLKIDTRVVKRLLPEIINKLEEYKKNYYHELETSISHYFLNAQLERYSTVDLSFFFSLGLSLAKEFKTAKEEIEISNPDISEHLTLGGL